MPRVLSLNVTDGGRRLHPTLAARLGDLAPDLVTLQEVRSDTVATWRHTLQHNGMHVADTFELARQHGHPPLPGVPANSGSRPSPVSQPAERLST